MSQFSYAKALLRRWGVSVEDIPTSDAEEKQEADFLTTFDGVRVLIEEKTKEDDPDYLAHRAEELERGEIHAATLPDPPQRDTVRHCPGCLKTTAVVIQFGS